MKEKLKYNFYIISLHFSQFYNFFLFFFYFFIIIITTFLICCAQGRHLFCNTDCSTEAISSGVGENFKQVPLKKKKRFYKVVFTELPFCIATVFNAKI